RNAAFEKRLGAVWQLKFARPPEKAIAALIEVLEDPDPRICSAAIDALGFHGAKAKDALPKLLKFLGNKELAKSTESKSVGTLPMTLGRMGKVAVPGLIEVLKDEKKPPFAHYQATSALAYMGFRAKDALPVLEKGLDSPYALIAMESAV